jgi:hypothetical protein
MTKYRPQLEAVGQGAEPTWGALVVQLGLTSGAGRRQWQRGCLEFEQAGQALSAALKAAVRDVRWARRLALRPAGRGPCLVGVGRWGPAAGVGDTRVAVRRAPAWDARQTRWTACPDGK